MRGTKLILGLLPKSSVTQTLTRGYSNLFPIAQKKNLISKENPFQALGRSYSTKVSKVDKSFQRIEYNFFSSKVRNDSFDMRIISKEINKLNPDESKMLAQKILNKLPSLSDYLPSSLIEGLSREPKEIRQYSPPKSITNFFASRQVPRENSASKASIDIKTEISNQAKYLKDIAKHENFSKKIDGKQFYQALANQFKSFPSLSAYERLKLINDVLLLLPEDFENFLTYVQSKHQCDENYEEMLGATAEINPLIEAFEVARELLDYTNPS